MKFRVWLLSCTLSMVVMAVHGTAQPQGAVLELPEQWALTPLMAPTQTMGLRVSSFVINESEQTVRRWREQHMASCRLPAASTDDDWHCFNEQYIYSLLWRAEGFIWVLSERLSQPELKHGTGAPQANLAALNAEVLSHSETAFESVTLLHSRRSLYGLHRDLLRFYSAQGARLVLQQQDSGGFIQQWQHSDQKVTYTAQKDDQGDVFVVQVRGTNL